jgi:hypothetical protein
VKAGSKLEQDLYEKQWSGTAAVWMAGAEVTPFKDK